MSEKKLKEAEKKFEKEKRKFKEMESLSNEFEKKVKILEKKLENCERQNVIIKGANNQLLIMIDEQLDNVKNYQEALKSQENVANEFEEKYRKQKERISHMKKDTIELKCRFYRQHRVLTELRDKSLQS